MKQIVFLCPFTTFTMDTLACTRSILFKVGKQIIRAFSKMFIYLPNQLVANGFFPLFIQRFTIRIRDQQSNVTINHFLNCNFVRCLLLSSWSGTRDNIFFPLHPLTIVLQIFQVHIIWFFKNYHAVIWCHLWNNIYQQLINDFIVQWTSSHFYFQT
jgi:hypothetical protein